MVPDSIGIGFESERTAGHRPCRCHRTLKTLYGSAARDQLQHQYDQRNHQQEMDQTADRSGSEPEQPEYEQNN
jgi:hypothetical protein